MKNKGFTLIELIISIVILGIIGAFTFQFIADSLESYIAVSDGEDVARETRLALERMAREVRAATNGVSDPIILPLAGASDNKISFNRTPTATDNSTQVTFQLTGGNFTRDRVSPTGNTSNELASNVSSFAVIRSLDNLITLDLTLAVSGQTPVRQRTLIYPRYFKYQ